MLVFPLLRLDWQKTVMKREKRTASSWPDADHWHRLDPQLGRDMENWFNDRFGGREFFLKGQARLDVALNGFIRNDDVFSGRGGWLFYNKGDSVRSYQNADLFSRFERQIIRKNIVTRADWLKSQGSSFYLLVVPAKNRVYGEFYPPGIHAEGSEGRAEQMVRNLQANTSVPVVFVLEELMAAKQQGTYLYFQQDTHWTHEGAFIGYQALMNRIHQEHPEAAALEASDFQWTTEMERGGDLTALTRLKSVPSVPKAHYTMLDLTKPASYQFVQNQHGEEYHTVCPGKPLKVWVFTDSFGGFLLPFLSSTFGEVVYVWSQLFNDYQQEMAAYHPDLVIHEIAERLMPSLLVNQPPLKPVETHAF